MQIAPLVLTNIVVGSSVTPTFEPTYIVTLALTSKLAKYRTNVIGRIFFRVALNINRVPKTIRELAERYQYFARESLRHRLPHVAILRSDRSKTF